MSSRPSSVDVLIVGSGPVGSTYARTLFELRPDTTIALVDAGPQLTAVPGVHFKNIANPTERRRAQLRSQGPLADVNVESAAFSKGHPVLSTAIASRPGTFYVDPDLAGTVDPAAVLDETSLPVAAMSSNVGGMAAHWTCACPHPAKSETVPFVGDGEWSELCHDARRILAVTTEAFENTLEAAAVLRALGTEFDDELPGDRRVQRMPLACRVEPDGTRYWSGTDVVLGVLATDPPPTFALVPETLCQRLRIDGDRVTGAELRDLRSGETYVVTPRAVVVACDAIRTPQLLWASDVRPRALGRFLNEHIQLVGAVALDPDLPRRLGIDPDATMGESLQGSDPTVGIYWIPYSDQHPFHGQVMHFDMSPVQLERPEDADLRQVVGCLYFLPKELRYENAVTYSDRKVDSYGMAGISITYGLTAGDRERIDSAMGFQARAAAAIGEFVPGRGPRILPFGSSLHYQGTTRMGDSNDGDSVCDAYSRVWDTPNLFLGGNGVLPTASASSPTLSSVALAVRAARCVASTLDEP